MLSKMFRTSALIVAFSVLACTAWAQSIEVGAVNPATHTLTITVKGTIGPILSGSDPLTLDGKSGTVKILASESLNAHETHGHFRHLHASGGRHHGYSRKQQVLD